MTKRLPYLVCSALLAVMAASVPACSSDEPGDPSSEGNGGNGQVTLPSGGENGDASGDGEGAGDGAGARDGNGSGDGGADANGLGGASSNPTSGTGNTSNPGTSGGTSTTTSGSACDNGVDDDGDGLIDGFDPECTGPFDDDEGTFATGIPGDNRDPKWQDCFFDGNSGAGDDGCRYHTDCLYGDRPADDKDCKLTEQCIDFCKPLTPNGCDCFGCCTVQLPDGGTVDVMEAATCSLANIGDADACPRCTKSTACANDCGECELCLGKTELPEHCTPPSTGNDGAGGAGNETPGGEGGAPNPPEPAYTCDNGEPVCGPDQPCEASYQYCSLGCCITRIR